VSFRGRHVSTRLLDRRGDSPSDNVSGYQDIAYTRPARSLVEPRAGDPNEHVLDRNDDGNYADHDIFVPVV